MATTYSKIAIKKNRTENPVLETECRYAGQHSPPTGGVQKSVQHVPQR